MVSVFTTCSKACSTHWAPCHEHNITKYSKLAVDSAIPTPSSNALVRLDSSLHLCLFISYSKLNKTRFGTTFQYDAIMLLSVNVSTKIIRSLKIIEDCAAPYWLAHNALFQGSILLEGISLEQAGSSIIYEKMLRSLIKQEARSSASTCKWKRLRSKKAVTQCNDTQLGQ